ncbi:MAG: hypothetical protein GX648_00135 [Crenarchaeota archaeon]|nr:hypothetical protein [Thermoproteota archaeon]
MSTLEKLIEEEYRKRYLELEVADEEDDVDVDIKLVIKAFKKWLAGKLVAGNEKANSHNDVILKLLAELKDGENKQ